MLMVLHNTCLVVHEIIVVEMPKYQVIERLFGVEHVNSLPADRIHDNR